MNKKVKYGIELFQEKEAGFKIMYPLYALCTFLGTLPVATGLLDTSYYKILADQTGGNFAYWDSKCRGELNFKIFH